MWPSYFSYLNIWVNICCASTQIKVLKVNVVCPVTPHCSKPGTRKSFWHWRWLLSPFTLGTKISFINLGQCWSECCHSKIASENSRKHGREIQGYSAYRHLLKKPISLECFSNQIKGNQHYQDLSQNLCKVNDIHLTTWTPDMAYFTRPVLYH